MSTSRIESVIKSMESKLSRGEIPNKVVLKFSPPEVSWKFLENDSIRQIRDILSEYNIDSKITYEDKGSFNLNRQWLETDGIDCFIYDYGVYPVDWNVEDLQILENLDYSGKLIIRYFIKNEGD